MSRLIDVFSDWMDNGIFHALESFDVPWKDDDISDVLDIEYFGNISGAKNISPLVKRLLDGAHTLTSEQIAKLARVVYTINSVNWNREYATINLEYNPINNYDMTEESTETKDRDAQQNNTGTQGVVSTSTETTGVYGFNSSSAVNSDTTSNSENNTRTDNLSQTLSDDETTTNELHRSGNIGVTTTQQMLESERNLYLWNFFYKVVFPSVDKVLTSPLY